MILVCIPSGSETWFAGSSSPFSSMIKTEIRHPFLMGISQPHLMTPKGI